MKMRVLHVGDDFAALRRCGLTLYSEALMEAQAANGLEVAYLFSGRHYPRLRGPRLKRWSQRGVKMYELVGSPIHNHWELGTRHPERDLDEPAGEAAFAAAVRESRPQIVHIHELARLPSSLIEHAKAARLPVVMSLYDYKPLCASVRLLDADGQRCLRREVGEDCARNCAGAPDDASHLIDWTLRYERARIREAIPFSGRINFSRLHPMVTRATSLVRSDAPSAEPAPVNTTLLGLRPADYQRRRDTNVARLAQCDRLIACSQRLAEIYATLGVDDSRMSVHRLTLPHLERLIPGRGPEIAPPLTFITLGGAASPSKGSRAILDAVRTLERAGRDGQYRLIIVGHVEPSVYDGLSHSASVSLAGFSADGTYDVDHVLDLADVGIIPSIWEEAHGFVGIEMIAKGLPIIGSALGGIPEYVCEGKTGWLNRTAGGAELGELMARAIDYPDEVEHLRHSVRSQREEFVRPMAANVAEVEAVYMDLMAGTAAPEVLERSQTAMGSSA